MLLYLSFLAAAARDMAMSPYAGIPAQQQMQAQDFNKLFKAEIDNLEFAEGLYAWNAEKVEHRILQKYGRLTS